MEELFGLKIGMMKGFFVRDRQTRRKRKITKREANFQSTYDIQNGADMTKHIENLKRVKFYPQAKQLNYNNAYVMALFALLAYESDKDAIRIGKTHGWKVEFVDIKETDTQALVATNEKAIIVAFRGTESLEDGITDLSSSRVAHPLGTVHEGFSQAFHSSKFKLVEAINKHRIKQPIWVTGHSLGAALATLATAYLQSQKMKPKFLYTFGSPRVGNPTFAKRFNKLFKGTSFRFRNNQDVVTSVPLPKMFAHVGEPLYFEDDGDVYRGMTGLEMSFDSAADTFLDKINPFKIAGVENLDDHRMGNYADNLLRLVRFA